MRERVPYVVIGELFTACRVKLSQGRLRSVWEGGIWWLHPQNADDTRLFITQTMYYSNDLKNELNDNYNCDPIWPLSVIGQRVTFTKIVWAFPTEQLDSLHFENRRFTVLTCGEEVTCSKPHFFANLSNSSEANWGPLSDISTFGTPYLANIVLNNHRGQLPPLPRVVPQIRAVSMRHTTMCHTDVTLGNVFFQF